MARAIAESSGNQFADSHLSLLRSTEDTYRAIISKSAGLASSGAITRLEATRRALYEFSERGITQFVDSANRRWGMQEYAEMATRTAITRAYVQGSIDRYKEDGRDLVIVSNSPEECELCRPYEGKILSLSGNQYDQPVDRVLPPRADPPVEEQQPTKKARKQKNTEEDDYISLTLDIESKEAQLNQLAFETDDRKSVFYNLRGRFPKTTEDDEYYDPKYAELRKKTIAVEDELSELKKKRDKLRKKILPSEISSKDFNKMEPQDKSNLASEIIKKMEKEADDLLHQIGVMKDNGMRDTPDFRALRARYEVSELKIANSRALLLKIKEELRRAMPQETRPESETTFTDHVYSRIAQGVSTEKDITEIGGIVRQKIHKEIENLRRENPDTKHYMMTEAYREIILETLSKIRHMGRWDGPNGPAVDQPIDEDNSDHGAVQALREATMFFPHAWLKISGKAKRMITKFVDRAYYSHNEHGASSYLHTSVDKSVYISSHEFSHRMEAVYPRIRELEKEFYKRRTKGEKLVKLKDIYGGGYRDDEVTKLDKFLHGYMGKEYSDDYYEILSMGVEHLYFMSSDTARSFEKWLEDTDYLDFIIGMLVAG
jgi:hypothetical protein